MRSESVTTVDHKEQLLYALLDEALTGPLPFRDDAAVLSITGIVKPGECVALCSTVQLRFRPRRLIICEPVVSDIREEDIVDYKDQVTNVTSGALWWKKTTTTRKAVEAARRTVRTVTARRVPRGAWSIHRILVGQRSEFGVLFDSTVSGEMFGPNNTMDLSASVCMPGISVTVQVENQLGVSAPFRALVLGEIVKDEPRGKLKTRQPKGGYQE